MLTTKTIFETYNRAIYLADHELKVILDSVSNNDPDLDTKVSEALKANYKAVKDAEITKDIELRVIGIKS